MKFQVILNWEGCFVFLVALTMAGVFYCSTTFSVSMTDFHIMTPTVVSKGFGSKSLSNDSSTMPTVLIHSHSGGKPKVAICLVGGLRAFELTGPSIKKYLLDEYKDAHVFVHAPLDADVHKLTVLSGVLHLASARLFVPHLLNESAIAKEVLTAGGSPHGYQGLLQYFNLVEGCVKMMEDYESRHHFKFDWVIRTRVDGYWNAPMPPVSEYNASKYHVPYGSGFGGLNDRLGFGTRETSWIALSRTSLLPQIHELGLRDLNSEKSFKAQLTANNVDVELHQIPFCVLSTRKYPGRGGVPVAAIQSPGPLNGAKCRPCTPTLVGDRARLALVVFEFRDQEIGPTKDPQLCEARKAWEKGWEQIYDTTSGPDLAVFRKSIANRSEEECMAEVESFRQEWESWDAPSAKALCLQNSV